MSQEKIQGNKLQTSEHAPNLPAWPRRRVLQSLVFCGQGAAAASAWAQSRAKQGKAPEAPKPEKRSFTVAIANPSALAYLPLLVAEKRGFFAQHGLDLEIVEYQSSARAMQAVGAGQADALCAWLENTLSPAGRALGLQSYVLMGRAPMMALGVASKSPSAPIPGLDQLRTRMLGVVALNSPTHTMAVALLRSAGLRSGDVRIVSVGSAASAAAALRSGQIDALMHMDPLMLQLEQRGEVHIVADLRSPELCAQSLGAALPSSCLCSTPDVLQRFPGMAQASADAMFQALQWLAQASLRDVLRLFPDGWPSTDMQLMVASLSRLRNAYAPEGLCAAPEIKGLWQAMLEAEPTLRLDNVDPLRSHTNAYVLRSAARLRG
jgi:NitT/TauT family transport system substrate-binding protein